MVQDRDPWGRKATAGLGVSLGQRRETEAARRKVEEENRLEREAEELLGRGIICTMSDKRPVEEIFKDPSSRELLREAGSAELASEAGRALGAVRLVARGSNTLRGIFVSLLNRAAITSEAILSTLLASIAAQDGEENAVSRRLGRR